MGFFSQRVSYAGPGRFNGEPEPGSVLPLEVPYAVRAPSPLLAQTETTALAITHVRVYPDYFVFPLIVRLRELGDLNLTGLGAASTFWLGRWVTHSLIRDPALRDERFTPGVVPQSPPPEVLRVGVQFSDGRSATNLDEWPPAAERLVTGPVLSRAGLHGRGAGRSWVLDYMVTPLPPSGQVRFYVEWPSRDVNESTSAIDGQLIRNAASQALIVWDSNSHEGGED